MIVHGSYQGVEAGDNPPEWVMYMPAGENVITPNVNGKAKRIVVNVTAKSAEVLQKALEKITAEKGPKPYVGFDHVAGAAGFWPQEFKWEDGEYPGVYVKAEWSKKGSESVLGKDYRYFSPTFLVSADNEIIGLPDMGEIGSLVNNPAFRQMKAVAASDNTNQSDNDMDDDYKKLQASLDAANKTIESLNAEISKMRKDKAECAVKAAVALGKIGAQDTATQEKWVNMILASADATALLDALPQTIKVQAGRITSDSEQKETEEKAPDYSKVMARATDLCNKGFGSWSMCYAAAENEIITN